MKTHRQTNIALHNATLRIEEMIYIAGAITDISAVSQPFSDFLDDERAFEECFDEIPEWMQEDIEDGYPIGEAFSEYLMDRNLFGFLVQFATPIITHYGDGSMGYSWGFYSTKWLYAETVEEVIEKGLAWAQERREQKK